MRCFCHDVHLYIMRGLVFTLICFTSERLSFAGDPESLKSQFLTEAPQNEAEYSKFAECLQGNVSLTFTVFDPMGKMKNRIRTRKEIKQNEKCASYLYQSFDGEKTDVDDKRTFGGLYAVNSVYAFELKRDNSKQDWVLEHLHMPGKGKATLFEGTSIHEMLFSWTAPMYDVYGRRLSALIREKTFQVTHASKISRNGRDLVQIDFVCPHPIQTNSVPYFVQGGSLLLDPGRYWSIQDSDLKTQSIDGTGTQRELFEFKAGSNGYPIVTRIVRTGKSPLGNRSEETFEIDLHEVSKWPPDQEFTLSAFGLPEPMGVAPIPSSRTWLWLLTAAVAAVGLAMMFAWLKRRHTNRDLFSSKAS